MINSQHWPCVRKSFIRIWKIPNSPFNARLSHRFFPPSLCPSDSCPALSRGFSSEMTADWRVVKISLSSFTVEPTSCKQCLVLFWYCFLVWWCGQNICMLLRSRHKEDNCTAVHCTLRVESNPGWLGVSVWMPVHVNHRSVCQTVNN